MVERVGSSMAELLKNTQFSMVAVSSCVSVVVIWYPERERRGRKREIERLSFRCYECQLSPRQRPPE